MRTSTFSRELGLSERTSASMTFGGGMIFLERFQCRLPVIYRPGDLEARLFESFGEATGSTEEVSDRECRFGCSIAAHIDIRGGWTIKCFRSGGPAEGSGNPGGTLHCVFLNLALPDDNHLPSRVSQFLALTGVSFTIQLELRPPVI